VWTLGPISESLPRSRLRLASRATTQWTQAARLAEEVAAGRLRVPIRRSYGLDDVPQALADFATPHVGKLAVSVD
jgi:NADPH:quinone reductase-like Zn-dependent oxidoreductase